MDEDFKELSGFSVDFRKEVEVEGPIEEEFLVGDDEIQLEEQAKMLAELVEKFEELERYCKLSQDLAAANRTLAALRDLKKLLV